MSTEPRATVSRQVLDYCRAGLEELQKDPVGLLWLLQWAATLVLLRTVGDTLYKVDAKANPAFAAACCQWFGGMEGRKDKDEIYWKFIRKHRNLLVHEFKFEAGQDREIQVTGFRLTANPNTVAEPPTGNVTARSRYLIKSKPFHNQDSRDVIARAIEWWKEQIDIIEKGAAGRIP